LASVRRVEIEVEFWPLITRRLLVVERLVLQGLAMRVEIDAQGRSNLEAILPAPAAALPAVRSAFGQAERPADPQEMGGLAWFRFRRVEIREGSLDWRRAGQNPLRLALKSLELEQPNEAGPAKVQAVGTLAENDFTLRGQVQGPGQEGQPWPVSASVSYPGAQLEVEGLIADPLAGRGLDLKLALKVAEPARGGLGELPGPWSLSGRLSDPQPRTYRLDGLELNGPAGTLAGWAQAALEGERPKFSAELAAQALDLGPLWNLARPGAKPGPSGAKGGPSQTGRVFSSAPLPLDSLQALAVDLDLKLAAGTLKTPSADLQEVDLRLLWSQGVLSLDPCRARLAGGPLELRLGLTPKGGQAQAKLNLQLKQCQVGQVLRRAGAEEVISGALDAQAEFQGHGGSLAAIMAVLGGKAVASVHKGRVNLRHLGILGQDLAGGIIGALGDAVQGSQSSALNCLVLGLLAKDGQVTSTAMALDSERLVMLGRGKVNLRTEELDVAMQPLPKSGLTAPGGVGLSLGQLVKPFKITGTLAQPRLSLDEAQALATLGKSLAGLAVLGPLGLAAGLASGGEGDSELCREALAAANKGVPYEPKGGVPRSLERMGEGIGDSLRKLFGN
jgi:uncharacterized protein involved in outer membrane biogenesis